MKNLWGFCVGMLWVDLRRSAVLSLGPKYSRTANGLYPEAVEPASVSMALIENRCMESAMTQPAAQYPHLTIELRFRIVDQVATSLQEIYILPDKAASMASHLQRSVQSGLFDICHTIPELATQLTQALRSVHEDLHLYVGPWLPPEDEREADQDLYEEMLRNKAWFNYDFRKLEVLLGNVGYMDLRSFCPARIAGETATAAMQFLAHTDALIFDLRDNGGGDNLVAYLQSYLFEEPTHMVTHHNRKGGDQQIWTQPYVPGARFVAQPIYVLISRSSFSAAEDFSFTLQRQGRVTVVGEQTRGGAHPVEFVRFPNLCIEMMIPNACSADPKTGDNWEDHGVIPDICVSAERALDVAHQHALRTLLERDDVNRELVAFRCWALEVLEARRTRSAPTAKQLSTYVGHYGQSVQVELKAGVLSFCWGGRRIHALTPLGEHEFEADHGMQRMRFVIEEGVATTLIWRQQSGEQWTLKRQA